MQVQQQDGKYIISLFDGEQNPLDKLSESLTFTLPAESETATVLASYEGGSDNWGGQFDAINQTIEFSTPYSGTYEVIENAAEIVDLADCDEQTAAAIRFMISKGYFSVDDAGDFDPNDTLNRYTFAEALVRMFFPLDRSLTTSFTDVPQDSPYYTYVASGEQDDTIEGFEDGTFRGETDMLREQVIALCSRTLADKKWYIYPADPSAYLTFADADAIATGRARPPHWPCARRWLMARARSRRRRTTTQPDGGPPPHTNIVAAGIRIPRSSYAARTMLLYTAFFVWHAAMTSPADNSRKVQKLKASASAGNGTLEDIETLAAAYQAAGRAWDAWLPDPWSVGKGQGEQRPDPVGRGVPAPSISQTEQEDGSLIVSVSDEDMARIERLRAYCSLDIFTDTECAQPDNSLLTGSRLLDSSNAALLYHLDQSGTFTVNVWYSEQSSDTAYDAYGMHSGPSTTISCTIDSITLASIAFGQLSQCNGYLSVENAHGAAIWYTLDGSDPLVNGTLTGLQSEETGAIRLPTGTYTVSVRCADSAGNVSDLLQDTFTVIFLFDSAGSNVTEDSQYEYFTTGSGPLFRCDKNGENVEVLDENTTYAVAAFDYYFRPDDAAMHTEAILMNEQQIRKLYYLTDRHLNTRISHYYYYDDRNEETFEQEARSSLRHIASVGQDFLYKRYSDGSDAAYRETQNAVYVESSIVKTLSLMMNQEGYHGDSGYLVKSVDGNSMVCNQSGETVLETADNTIVLDAAYAKDDYADPILLYHYKENPTEHYIFTGRESIVNEQMTGRTLLGYTENGVYYLDSTGEAVQEPFNYAQFAA